jgi:hypothetical protein
MRLKCPSIFMWTLEMLRDALEARRPDSRVGRSFDTADRMIGYALQEMAQVEFRVEIVEFGRAEQAVNGSSPLDAISKDVARTRQNGEHAGQCSASWCGHVERFGEGHKPDPDAVKLLRSRRERMR